jgi:hypothetical protein
MNSSHLVPSYTVASVGTASQDHLRITWVTPRIVARPPEKSRTFMKRNGSFVRPNWLFSTNSIQTTLLERL